ncbi:hypothetical protein EON79_03695 [bacterium]|nr:MAG: hypothetical protein EON79_03695 [bacterium]
MARFRILSNTGGIFYPEPGVAIHPHEPTEVEELTEAMRYQANNLRIVEVGEDGEPVGQRRPEPEGPKPTQEQLEQFAQTNGLVLLPIKDFDALNGVGKRLQGEKEALEKQLEDSGSELQKQKNDRSAEVDSLRESHRTELEGLQAGHQREIADLTAERDQLKQDSEALVALRKEVEASAAKLSEEPDPVRAAAIDAVIGMSQSNLERFPEDTLGALARAKGIEKIPDTKQKLIEALKAKIG